MTRHLQPVPDPEPEPDWEEFTDTISNRYARCRGTNHWWDPFTVEVLGRKARPSGYVVTEKCDRCGATRSRTLDAQGFITAHGHRTYPDGYLAPKGLKGVSVSERKASMRRRVLLDTTQPTRKKRRPKP